MSEFIPLISVVIPTYNRAEMLGITIESFVNQQYPHDNYEIIVSDNNSSDNTKEIVSKWQSKADVKIKYIFEKRQGVHYARNSAGKIASGEILYYTDDDMIADGLLLSELVRVFSLDPKIGTATGLVLPRFDSEPPEWVKKYLINGYLSLTDKDKPEDLIVSKHDIGVYSCHQAIRRDVFYRSGGFNPENTSGIWIGDGETGLNIKIKALGCKFAYTSKAVIHHMIPKNRTTLQYLIRRIGNQGFCDSYTEYREHRNREKIMFIMLKRNVIDAMKLMLFTIIRVLIGRLSWHFIPANFSYLCKRNTYDLKLYRDENFRKLVEIDNWLDNESNMSEF
jgi:glucosyl-dolichyl phosphate glucuronosyltransferase